MTVNTARPLATATATVPPTKKQDYTSLRINGARLMETIHSTCEWGKAHAYGDHPTETGMDRLSLNDDDKRVRDWLVAEARSLGCAVTVDQMGNMFCVRPGRDAGLAPVYVGSHLDTQPTGGRYDGILGVTAGLEALRTLHEAGYETEGPVGLINWTNEEGARFPIVTVSSAVWAGAIPLETAWSCQEVTPPAPGTAPQTMKQELSRIGYLGTVPASHAAVPIAAHFELHIEQGPILEDAAEKIGVVTGGQAYSWFEVVVRGQDSHAGTTPMAARRDALLAAARMVSAGNDVAKRCGGLVTTGIFQVQPGSVNTMAHTVRFTLDVRHPKDAVVAEMVSQCKEEFARIAKEDCEKGVEAEWKQLAECAAVEFDKGCVAAVEAAAEATCAALPESDGQRRLWRHMVSGAGHDSCQVSRRSPAAMVFTPTRNGMSHTPVEYCSPEDCVTGAQVLLQAVMRYDAGRKRGSNKAV